MNIRGVDFVMHRVGDLSRAVRFYRDVLGLTLLMQNEEYHWAEFDCGNLTLALHGGEAVSQTVAGPRVALAVDISNKPTPRSTPAAAGFHSRCVTLAFVGHSKCSILMATRSSSTGAPMALSGHRFTPTRRLPTMNAKCLSGALAIVALASLGCEPGTKSGRGFHMPSGNAERGKAAFVQLNCTGCHVVDGVQLAAPETRKMEITLGGTVHRARTYGELVTSIIDPSRDLTLKFPSDEQGLRKGSPMKARNHEITVEQLIDIVTFLEQHYQVASFSEEQVTF